MDKSQEKRANELAEELKEAGLNSGLLVMQGQVVLRSPGSPYTDAPLLFFQEADLNNALSLGLLQKGSVVGSSLSWEWYVLSPAK
jgi:hypothetical protein